MRQKPLIVGTWRGAYSYDAPEMREISPAAVGFELRLTQTRWQCFWGRFAGHVTDDAPFGVPGEGDIEGSCTDRRVRFTKLLPELHLAGPQGLMSLSDFLATHDYKLQGHFAHPPIYYDGEVAEDGSVNGTWLMEALNLRLDANGSELPFPRSTGTFQMRRI